jgi:LmbE family N-acetylglucosaminyl deacetylase
MTMLTLSLGQAERRPRRILVLGAHSDDIEIGCGGTILQLASGAPEVEVCWVVLSGSSERAAEARASADDFLEAVAHRTVHISDFRDGFFPYQGSEIKEFLENLKQGFSPDLVLTHQRADLHQDHRLVADLTWNTFRDHLILEYEIPKYDGDLGAPNVFVRLTKEIARRKVDLLLRGFPSQRTRRWFTEDVFLALLRLRGMESNAPDGYAEGFYGRKVIIG